MPCVKVKEVSVGIDATDVKAVASVFDEVSANTGVTPATSDDVAIVAAVTQTRMRLFVSSRKNFDIPISFIESKFITLTCFS